MKALAVCLAAACSLWACTTSSPEPTAADPAPKVTFTVPLDDDAPEVAVEAVISPTPEMLRAALANDPEAMRDAAVALSGCQASTTCPAQFASCTAWSASTQCSSSCGPGVCICKPVLQCEGEPPEPKGIDSFNSYRVCFDANQNACTQWSKTTSTYCGC